MRFQVVVCQVREEFAAKGSRLITYLKKIKQLLEGLEHYSITHIPRAENQKADRLAKIASSDNPKETEMVSIEVLESPNFDLMEAELALEFEPERES